MRRVEPIAETTVEPVAETPVAPGCRNACLRRLSSTSLEPVAALPEAAGRAGLPMRRVRRRWPPRASKRAKGTGAAARLNEKELKKKRLEEQRIKAFRDYFNYSEELRKIPPHRVLAINRGERAKVLRVKIECRSGGDGRPRWTSCSCRPGHPHADYLRGCARDSLSRLILPGLEREVRRELTDHAELHAVGVFAKNLRNLLLQPPVRGRRVLAVDPGFKSGCKLAALDQFGNMLAHDVIYLIGKPERRQEARSKVARPGAPLRAVGDRHRQRHRLPPERGLLRRIGRRAS